VGSGKFLREGAGQFPLPCSLYLCPFTLSSYCFPATEILEKRGRQTGTFSATTACPEPWRCRPYAQSRATLSKTTQPTLSPSTWTTPSCTGCGAKWCSGAPTPLAASAPGMAALPTLISTFSAALPGKWTQWQS
jgi:hypothetical protein